MLILCLVFPLLNCRSMKERPLDMTDRVYPLVCMTMSGNSLTECIGINILFQKIDPLMTSSNISIINFFFWKKKGSHFTYFSIQSKWLIHYLLLKQWLIQFYYIIPRSLMNMYSNFLSFTKQTCILLENYKIIH